MGEVFIKNNSLSGQKLIYSQMPFFSFYSAGANGSLEKSYLELESLIEKSLFEHNLPIIKKIDVKNNPEDGNEQYDANGKYQKPTVIVTFADDTTEKASTSKEDTFSLEQGISICYTKKLLSTLIVGNGSRAYNKILNNAMKLYKSQREELLKKEKEVQLAKERTEKLAAKRAERKAKYEAKKKEQEISIQAEAYARALKMVNK